jgi:hypothetical protein
VADLDGSSVLLDSKGNWEATVTITVHNTDGIPFENATVAGSWGNCTTDGSGQCTLTSGLLRKNKSTTTFTVDDVARDLYTYTPASNTDPDGDSDGTTIIVAKP